MRGCGAFIRLRRRLKSPAVRPKAALRQWPPSATHPGPTTGTPGKGSAEHIPRPGKKGEKRLTRLVSRLGGIFSVVLLSWFPPLTSNRPNPLRSKPRRGGF